MAKAKEMVDWLIDRLGALSKRGGYKKPNHALFFLTLMEKKKVKTFKHAGTYPTVLQPTSITEFKMKNYGLSVWRTAAAVIWTF